ncbi:hypothetical protein ES708_11636 [subsurface metagenome]
MAAPVKVTVPFCAVKVPAAPTFQFPPTVMEWSVAETSRVALLPSLMVKFPFTVRGAFRVIFVEPPTKVFKVRL